MSCYICINPIKFESDEERESCCYPKRIICSEELNHYPKCFSLPSPRGVVKVFICSRVCEDSAMKIRQERYIQISDKSGFISPM